MLLYIVGIRHKLNFTMTNCMYKLIFSIYTQIITDFFWCVFVGGGGVANLLTPEAFLHGGLTDVMSLFVNAGLVGIW